METQTSSDRYYIWGIDQAAYGPVDLPTLIEWIKDERVLAETWVFSTREELWQPAKKVVEIEGQFAAAAPATVAEPVPGGKIKPGSLRRIKILADLSDMQLAHLVQFVEPLNVLQFKKVFVQGDPGDAMYMVLGGELRARLVADEKETILATFTAGEFFGDMALFDQGTRSADVVANVDSTLLKLSSVSFERLVKEAPALATPFLQSAARTLAARIRVDNKRLARITEQFSASR